MGFWSSLIPDAANIVGSIVKYSGAITPAIDAIAAVVRSGVGDAEGAGEEATDNAPHADPVVHLHKLVGDAEQILLKKAKDIDVKHPRGDYSSTAASLTGIWQNPVLIEHGSAALPMYQDVAKFLSLHGVPAIIQDAGDPIPVARSLSDALFANASASSDQVGDGHDHVRVIKQIQIPSGDKDSPITIYAKHAYYTVPLGEGARQDYWHSAIHVVIIKTPHHIAAHNPEPTQGVIYDRSFDLRAPSATGTGSPKWLVTFVIQWDSAVVAANSQAEFVRLVNAHKLGYDLKLNSLVGTLQHVKILAPTDVTPGSVRQAVISVCAKILNTGKDAGNPGGLPSIEITKESLVG